MALNANHSGPDKAALRRAVLARRASLPPQDVARASLRACALVERLESWQAAREALVYFAFRGEIDPGPLLQGLWRRGVRVLAPRCRPGEAGALELACVTCLDEMAPGAYGILEPDPSRCPAVGGFRPDVALVPAVAFDARGFRLGFGQGYYDRLLAGPGFARTFLIGMAHPFQLVDELPTDPWDQPVHAVVTEEGVMLARPPGPDGKPQPEQS